MSQTIELTPMEEQPPVPMRTSDTQEQFNVKTQNWMGVWKNNVTIWNNNLPALNTGLNAALAVAYALPSIETVIPELSNITTVAGIAADVSAVSEVKESVVTCATNLPAIIAAPAAAAQAAQSATNAAASAASLHLPVMTASDDGKTLVWDGSAQQWGTSYAAPVGTIVMYPEDLPEPDGWLRCNGGDMGTGYPELAAVLGGTVLPSGPREVISCTEIDSGIDSSSPLYSLQIEHMAINSATGDIFVSTSTGKIWVQYGGTGGWSALSQWTRSGIKSLAVDYETNDLWVAMSSAVYVLRNGGTAFEQKGGGGSTTDIIHVSVDPLDPTKIYYASMSTVYRSLNKGTTWSNVVSSLSLAATDALNIVTMPGNKLFVSSGKMVYYGSGSSPIVTNLSMGAYNKFDGTMWGANLATSNFISYPTTGVTAYVCPAPFSNDSLSSIAISDSGDMFLIVGQGKYMSLGCLLHDNYTFKNIKLKQTNTLHNYLKIHSSGDLLVYGYLYGIDRLRVRIASGIIKAE